MLDRVFQYIPLDFVASMFKVILSVASNLGVGN
jgi:hypothetical protein